MKRGVMRAVEVGDRNFSVLTLPVSYRSASDSRGLMGQRALAIGFTVAACALAFGCGPTKDVPAPVDQGGQGDDDGADASMQMNTSSDAGTANTNDASVANSSKDSGAASAKDASTPPPVDANTPPVGPDSVQITVEPGDKGDVVLNAIEAAKKSIHMTMYLLDDTRFINALIAQKKAGLDVKVVLEDFANNAQTSMGSNSAVYNQLKSAGVSVAWAPATYTLTHEKCVIIDGSAAWIMTMNLETTAPTANREYLALDTTAADVEEAEAIFEADYAGTAITPTGNLLVAPNDARQQLILLIQSAKTSVDLEGEELSDYMIVDTLVAMQKVGVTIHVVLSTETPTSEQTTAVAQLKAANVSVKSLSTPTVHAKALVADQARAYVGSMNFTTGSLQYNRELGLITNNAASVALVKSTIDADYTAGM
jgi:cardiolipin synthase